MAILWSTFTFLTGLARSFIGIIIPRTFVGVGEAGFVPGGTALISAAYSKESRGKALGIFNIAIPLGAAAGVALGGIISTKYGWRTPFLFFAIPGVILGIMALFMKDYKTPVESEGTSSTKGFGQAVVDLLKLPTLRWYYLAYGLATFMTTSVLAWLPSLIMRTMNVSEAVTGLIVGVIVLSAIIGAPLGGFLADFWQKKNNRGRLYVPALSDFMGGILIVLVIIAKFSPIGIALAVLYGITTTMAVPAVAAISQDVASTSNKGLSMGLTYFTSYMLGGAWGPYVIGKISDALGGGADGLGTAVMFSGLGGIIAGVLFFIASRSYPSDLVKIKQDIILTDS